MQKLNKKPLLPPQSNGQQATGITDRASIIFILQQSCFR